MHVDVRETCGVTLRDSETRVECQRSDGQSDTMSDTGPVSVNV